MERDYGKHNFMVEVVKQLTRKQAVSKRFYPKDESGFTLVELLVVVILVGVIAAIAAPGWIGFVNQRRVNAANDVIFNALQEAHSEAKRTKLSYSVSFKTGSGKVPEVAVYRTKKADGTNVDPTDTNQLNPKLWRSLGKDLNLKSGQVLLGTNITGENSSTSPTQVSYTPPNTAKITFDYMGTLPLQTGASIPDKGLIIQVGAPVGNSSDRVVPSSRRCVKVLTLLGSMQFGKGDQCNPT